MPAIRFDPRSPDLTGTGSFPTNTFKPGSLGMRTAPTLAVSAGRVGTLGGGRLTQIRPPTLRATMAATLTPAAAAPAAAAPGNGGQAAVGGGLLAGVVILLALMSSR